MRQLELNLIPRTEHKREAAPWKYRFTKDSLVEEFEGRRLVYGLWELLFGCWIVDPVTQQSREIIPTWRPLNENGIWRDQREIRAHVSHSQRTALSSRWRYAANAAFAGYFANIPQWLRLLAAPFEHYQWLALDLIWQDHRFSRFLDDELFNEREQFVFSCCVLADAAEQSRAWRHEFAGALMTEKRAALLDKLSGLPCSKATMRAIYKLGPTPCSKKVYQGLINFVNDHPISKVLRHANLIPPGVINVLEQLPRELLQTNIVNILLKDLDFVASNAENKETKLEVSVDNLAGLFAMAPPKLKTAIANSFRQVRDLDQLFSYMDRWENRLIEAIRFPPPPVPSVANLVPLSSAAAMREEARQMQNCLASLIPYVLQERAYFFHWDDTVPATVMLENTPGCGWSFYRALGVGNEPILQKTENSLRSLISESARSGYGCRVGQIAR